MSHKVRGPHPNSHPDQPPSETLTDSELFRHAVGCVAPIKSSNRATTNSPPPLIVVESKQGRVSMAANPLSDHTNEDPPNEFLSNGLSRLTLRKLRRGQYTIQGRLDLHGYTSDVARQFLFDFIRAASHKGLRCVLIIHSKGLNSQHGEAILKARTRHWLTQLSQVLAFCDAPPTDGGTGAVVILLRTTLSQP